MKIAASVRTIYDEIREKYERLKMAVDPILESVCSPRWHYEGRVKSQLSFAQKLETGRVTDPYNLEDFFACMIVVENRARVDDAEKLVAAKFPVANRRPLCQDRTHKSPDSFPFDDLRLFCNWQDSDALPPSGLHGTLFEVQIKTFLQHAWGIATHDLVYKGNEVNWSRERLAFEIRAMLEHAEASIAAAELVTVTPHYNKTDLRTRRLREILEVLGVFWKAESLPDDRVRLAESIAALIDELGIPTKRLREILTDQTNNGRGAQTLNLSPFSAIVQAMFDCEPKLMFQTLAKKPKRWRLVIPAEVELSGQAATQTELLRKAIILGSGHHTSA